MSRLDVEQLLDQLLNLYQRLARWRLESRMASYRAGGGEEPVEDISTPLAKQIEALAQQAARAESPAPTQEGRTGSRPASRPGPAQATAVPHQMNLFRRSMNGLSRYLKGSGESLVVQPHLSDQLQESIRQHVHTALRLARQGDSRSAKLHADLASNGMHELSHFLPREEFLRFKDQVRAELHGSHTQEVFKPLADMLERGVPETPH